MLECLTPEWCVDARVGALMSTRRGGVSTAPYDSLNLGGATGDAAESVAENQRRFAAELGAPVRYLRQVHGATVLRLAADCLPVLLAAPQARGVGAAHAGWRGLAAGVLEATVQALCEAAHCAPRHLKAWLGPCIGPRRFEVGADVLDAFGAAAAARFVPRARADGSPRWLADLPGLARDRLHGAGVRDVSGGAWCTVEDASRFFSFRRDGVTGRMAAAVWIRGRGEGG